jgi:hypothetical protein
MHKVLMLAAVALMAGSSATAREKSEQPKPRKICRNVQMSGRITPQRICRVRPERAEAEDEEQRNAGKPGETTERAD